MIYFTGDIHGEIDIGKLSYRNWAESRNLTADDYLIIMGDFGLPFPDSDVTEQNQPARSAYKYWVNSPPPTLVTLANRWGLRKKTGI